ncbi:cytochrome ubiquinol oxidase subunit I [Pendulispora rubella]|uniref:Cytochrome ubiquinol oxidase subunit I n=1 Tax=Pendulispora rubella TaxID=2741070 RepID=A0ABZ2KXT6_9BACT
MDALTAARAQMEVSLGFHMIFAALGIALPGFMCVAEALYLRTGRPHYLALAKRWSKATSLLFAIGAVSGTALSFELGLLWPRFMEFAGGIIGSAFALEGYAFFVEAIFIGLYLYGWDRISPRAHWFCGLAVTLSGTASGVLVLAANAWMQAPRGFDLVDGRAVNIDPWGPFQSPSWLPMSLHMTLAAYVAVAFAIAGVYAKGILRGKDDDEHRSALRLAMIVGAVTAVLQLLSGDISARVAAEHQPAKLAAMEAHYETRRGAPFMLGGIADDATETVRYGIEVPYALSLLIGHDPNTEVTGLDRIPRNERPPTALVHIAFDVMVASGMGLIAVGLGYWLMRWRAHRQGSRDDWTAPKWLLSALVLASPLGFLAIEAGWVVSEVGRQPWVIFKVMRTRDAVTPAAGVELTFALFVLLYAALGVTLVFFLRRMARRTEVAHGA